MPQHFRIEGENTNYGSNVGYFRLPFGGILRKYEDGRILGIMQHDREKLNSKGIVPIVGINKDDILDFCKIFTFPTSIRSVVYATKKTGIDTYSGKWKTMETDRTNSDNGFPECQQICPIIRGQDIRIILDRLNEIDKNRIQKHLTLSLAGGCLDGMNLKLIPIENFDEYLSSLRVE